MAFLHRQCHACAIAKTIPAPLSPGRKRKVLAAGQADIS
ncbi:hypothetical protein RNAN_0992 [Rheinheimera nanhaiensis E407-8]|uniref:Uncharacterized protein n=1 Tax=Rheinheimera nanhaiensis E407-8 TaxID=562729 RepID=I1DVE3_9GAMM|nr:hypothetical protein RNAN_0992 [Rheinheimera nanhaiensis E407-8]